LRCVAGGSDEPVKSCGSRPTRSPVKRILPSSAKRRLVSCGSDLMPSGASSWTVVAAAGATTVTSTRSPGATPALAMITSST